MQAYFGWAKACLCSYRSFSLSRNKKKLIGNRPVEEAKKMKCYKRLIYKQFFQASGLCGQQFLSYLPKPFTHLCRAFVWTGDAILVYRFGAPIWPLENSFFSLEN